MAKEPTQKPGYELNDECNAQAEKMPLAVEEIQNGEKKTKRETWSSTTESFLSHLGAVIGLGNIWRFPYITYTYGGGAFLIPYIMFAVLCGFPMLFLEVALGQYTREGAVNAWNLSPLMKGIGFGCAAICLYSCTYYITVMAWGIFYLVHTFTTRPLPWMHCDNWWNTNSCITYDTLLNGTMSANISLHKELPIIEFWDRYVLRKSVGLETMGSIDNWQMVLSLIAAWVLIYFCIFKGVKSTGKVVYFSATFPYVVLAILLVRGCTLPGAAEGIRYYLQPNLTKLQDPNVWVQAGSQVCYSYAICFTVLVAFGSYNDFHIDCYKHTIILTTSCSMTSFVAGFAIFSVLGNLAEVTHKNVSDVVASGPGLAFQIYPSGLSLLPLPHLWNALFFLMIITVAIDSQFCCLEGFVTIICGSWKWANRNKELFNACLCSVLLVFGLVFMTEGGIYVFEIFNNYAVSGIALLFLATMQSIAIGWIYGADKFYEHIKEMIGYYPSAFLKFCWVIATPTLTTGVFLFFLIKYKPLKIGEYEYPGWANAIGWCMCLSSCICVPAYAVYQLLLYPGSLRERYRKATASIGKFEKRNSIQKDTPSLMEEEYIVQSI
uniref:sodium- and chloride-dependent GABA transporter 2 n=1 Tax=Ciona intestinalis TaxID=7719 RepID=UPI000180CF79|nr:sodium- and chloride-dependent GABA transporter 2 [Ciona intestinalis]|eukprot:XP_002126972.1 sodium- and chloride-dependent GABA transporter 2 [Ciona intestinalis]